MFRLTTAAMIAVLACSAFAQETYWIANRASNDIMEVTAWGSVKTRIAMPGALRSAHRAPDGKVWVIRFITGTFDIVDPMTQLITPVTSMSGNPFDLVFDAAGHAWITGGPALQEFSPAGVHLQNIALSATAPLGITIDQQGNKWIAHRANPPSVTRVDPSGVATNFIVVGAAPGYQPVRATADFRGLVTPSHIWLTGDGPSQLVEMDGAGNTLNVYTLPAASTGGVGPITDLVGNVWVGSFGTGALMQVSNATGAVLNTYTFPPSINGLSIDSFGRLLCAARITFGPPTPPAPPGGPCELRRVSPTTGALEVNTQLQFGSFVGWGTQSAASTPQHTALVADQLGDLDGDGDVNYIEIVNGTSSIDPCSNQIISVNTIGITTLGNTPAIEVRTAPGNFWTFAFANSVVAPGSGVTIPGFACEALLDPLTIYPGTLSGSGPANVPVFIPNNPALQNFTFYMQGMAIIGGTSFRFTNVTGMRVW